MNKNTVLEENQNELAISSFDNTNTYNYNQNCSYYELLGQAFIACCNSLVGDKPLNLENGIPQTKDSDMPCIEGENDMAQRIKQRVRIGGEIKWATGYNMQDVIKSAALMLIQSGYTPEGNFTKTTPLFENYLELYQAKHKQFLRPNTIAAYAHLIKNHILPKIGTKQMHEIEDEDIQSLYDEMVKKGLSRGTIKKVRNIINPCFDFAVEKGLIPKNPCASKHVQIHTNKEYHHKPLPTELFDNIKIDIPSLPDNERRMMALLCYSGMRVGEILGLRWEDIDFKNSFIRVQRGITHPSRNQPIVGELKTKSSYRKLPICQELENALTPCCLSGYIFGCEKPLTYQQDRLLWKKLRERYQLNDYSRHDFRDTCATVWKEQGIELIIIQAMLGHDDISTTAKYYTKVRDTSLHEARRKMDAHNRLCDTK